MTPQMTKKPGMTQWCLKTRNDSVVSKMSKSAKVTICVRENVKKCKKCKKGVFDKRCFLTNGVSSPSSGFFLPAVVTPTRAVVSSPGQRFPHRAAVLAKSSGF